MRYFVWLFALLSSLPALAYNEVIPAVAYNPSRLGAFTHLKAVRKLSLASGLGASSGTLNFLANGPIRVSNNSSMYGCNAACDTDSLDQISNIKPVGTLEHCEEVANDGEGKCALSTSASGSGILESSSGTIYNAGSGAGSYSINGVSSNSGVTIVLKGSGALTVTGAASVSSFSPAPSGVTAETTRGTALYIKESAKLGTITIPSTVRCGGATCSRYQFVDRVSNNNHKYKVLAAVR